MPAIPSSKKAGFFFLQVATGTTPSAAFPFNSLLVGRAASDATAAENELTRVISVADADERFGSGSPLSRMAAAFFRNNSGGLLWALPQIAAAGTPATWEHTVGAAAYTSARLTVDDQAVNVSFTANDDNAEKRAAAIVSAVNKAVNLPLTAANAGADLTFTHKANTSSNNAVKLTATTAAAANASLELDFTQGTGEIAPNAGAVGDEPFEQFIFESTDAKYTGGGGFQESVLTPRWQYDGDALYGHAIYAVTGSSVNTIVAAAANRNDSHETIIGVNTPTNAAEVAAAVAAVAARELDADVNRPLRTVQVYGIAAPAAGKSFSVQEQDVLLNNKVATLKIDAFGGVFIERLVTTYNRDANDNVSLRYLDYEKMATLAYFFRDIKTFAEAKYSRAKITPELPAVINDSHLHSPASIKTDIVARYAELAERGIVEDVDGFAEAITVEIDPNDDTRVNIVLPVSVVNGLRIVAVKAEVQ